MDPMATRDQMSKAIAPGSTDYGDRQALTQNLPSPQGAPGGGQAPNLAPPQPTGGPLDRLLDGKAAKKDAPLTEGLSVGPGSTPGQGPAPLDGAHQRLLWLATNGASPRLQRLARAALKRRVQGAQ